MAHLETHGAIVTIVLDTIFRLLPDLLVGHGTSFVLCLHRNGGSYGCIWPVVE